VDFAAHCQQIAPNLTVLLFIPPALDLVYHNETLLRSFPRDISVAYATQLEFRPARLHRDSVDRNIMLRDLIAVEDWAQDTTTTFYTDSAVKISNMKRRIEDFTKGDILTYGANGFL